MNTIQSSTGSAASAISRLANCALLLICGQATAQLPATHVEHEVLRIGRVLRVTHVNDRLTSRDMSEYGADRSGPLAQEGAIFYLPWRAGTSRMPVYRLFRSAPYDHADDNSTTFATSPGYVLEGRLGYAWRQSRPGTVLLQRFLDPSIDDRATYWNPPPGYSAEQALGHGYPRFGTSEEVLYTVSAGGVSVSVNEVAGGAVWVWDDGAGSVVNIWDYGRQIQNDVGYLPRNLPGTELIIPTEAGARRSWPHRLPENRHASIATSITTRSNTLSTRCIPLAWEPAQLGGGEDLPVAMVGMTMGKDITLDYAGLGPVSQYASKLSVHSLVPRCGSS